MFKPEPTLSLKLLIDPKSKRVLFAEAGKDTVDFIIHILSLPLASVTKLVGKQEMVGCLGNLYDSVENLETTYIQRGRNKETVLKPSFAPFWTLKILLSLFDKNVESLENRIFRCHKCRNSVAYWSPPSDDGFVKDVVTYTVTDDLVVKPVSPKFTIDLLNKYNIKELTELKEMEVSFGMDEALKLLKASLHSNSVLTTVFFKDACM